MKNPFLNSEPLWINSKDTNVGSSNLNTSNGLIQPQNLVISNSTPSFIPKTVKLVETPITQVTIGNGKIIGEKKITEAEYANVTKQPPQQKKGENTRLNDNSLQRPFLPPTNKTKLGVPTKPKKAILTVYNPTVGQTDSSPHTGGFMTKMEFGDVAIGNRNEYNKAKSAFFKDGTDTFIKIPELEKIKTPYGNGIFRVRDTMNIRFNGNNKVDVFIPQKGSPEELMVRQTPSASYSYL